MKNLKLASMLLSLTVTTLSLPALADSPTKCPSVEQIISGGLPNPIMKVDEKKFYGIANRGSYGTQHTWGFGVAIPYDQATDELDATNKAKAALNTLRGNPKPEFNKTKQTWSCFYHNAYHFLAYTVTPIPAE